MEKPYLTLLQACEILGKQPKTIYRYVKRGWLHPEVSLSSRGTTQYLFYKADLDALKTVDRTTLDNASLDYPTLDQTGQEQEDLGIEEALGETTLDQTRPDLPRQDTNQEVVSTLREHVAFLREQITVKDEQIKDLSKRNEVAIGIIGSFQKERMAIEAPKPEEPHHEYGYREHETDGSADASPYE